MLSTVSSESLIRCPFTVAPVLSPDQSVEVVVGEDLVLSTIFTGFNLPITNIVWTRNGEMISSATDRITISISGIATPNGTTTLTLSPVNAPSDGGTYIVAVTNPAGSDMTVFAVNVTGELTYTMHVLLLNNQQITCMFVSLHWANFTISK